MANISPALKRAKLAALTAAIMSHTPFSQVCKQMNADSNNLRGFMHRNGMPIPADWMPRKWQRRDGQPTKGGYIKNGTQMAAHTRASIAGRKTSLVGMSLTGNGSTLTAEQRATADALRITHDRMAYLLACPHDGNARGWQGGSAIG